MGKRKTDDATAAQRTPRDGGRANYGAHESRRECAGCGSVESTVDSVRRTGRLIVRYRVCLACKRRRITQDVIPVGDSFPAIA